MTAIENKSSELIAITRAMVNSSTLGWRKQCGVPSLVRRWLIPLSFQSLWLPAGFVKTGRSFMEQLVVAVVPQALIRKDSSHVRLLTSKVSGSGPVRPLT
jgi:hypothetical protein